MAWASSQKAGAWNHCTCVRFFPFRELAPCFNYGWDILAWVMIVAVDVFSDGHDQLFEILENYTLLARMKGQDAPKPQHFFQSKIL